MIKYNKILKEYKEKYGIRYKVFNDVVMINTNMGDWIISPHPTSTGRRYQLKHKNTIGNSGKFHYHNQNFYDEFIYGLKYIVTHDIKRFYPNYEVPEALGA